MLSQLPSERPLGSQDSDLLEVEPEATARSQRAASAAALLGHGAFRWGVGIVIGAAIVVFVIPAVLQARTKRAGRGPAAQPSVGEILVRDGSAWQGRIRQGSNWCQVLPSRRDLLRCRFPHCGKPSRRRRRSRRQVDWRHHHAGGGCRARLPWDPL